VLSTSRGAQGARILRRLNTPKPVRVRTDGAGRPVAVLRHGRWLLVAEELDRYRTDDRWWTAEPVARTYYELLLDDGPSATVFREDASGSWYEQRY